VGRAGLGGVHEEYSRLALCPVRFVPDPKRGEFINVGAIVGSDQNSDWKVRRIENPKRARYMDEHHTLDAVWDFLDRIERNQELSESKLEQEKSA
jgi:hypothetical protein